MRSDCWGSLALVRSVGPATFFECKACGAECTAVDGIDGIERWTEGHAAVYRREAPSWTETDPGWGAK